MASSLALRSFYLVASARQLLSHQWRKNGPISIFTLSRKRLCHMMSSSSSRIDTQTEDDGLAPMEVIKAALPSLSLAELKRLEKKIPELLYFCPKVEYLPANAYTLISNGTIKVLEVTDNHDDDWLSGDVADFLSKCIKMKIKGIEETVNLNYIQYYVKEVDYN
ncbi:PREDICTED: uncharacterized protein LOC109590841 [Amphimedon queenslandica]|uniref:Uncharacterized protein n=1 Tax=Amphimedon queenslandica TaxID=400682 RepID=A0A1X7SYQ1_AMPQE|nr:PREDICTED: uncharacterized protein LOC109590841 [Amphimedon queenslandica]|eukprot:XP_019862269.1 PREDICTED: uncharacterized protein LOC109590841 [Amphimedon queenslandica]